MLNIFDLSTGISGSKMPTEKSRRNGSPVCRGHPNVVKKDTNAGQVNHNLRRASEVPVKMLTLHETCKEKETGRSSPCVVAKLMGLDSLPVQPSPVQPFPPIQPSPPVSSIIIPKSRTKNSYTIGEAILGYQPQQESAYPDEMLLHDVRPFHDHIDTQVEYKDIYKVRKQPSRANSFKNELSLEERYGNYPREKMDLVHQKFMEAKRLAMNHNQLHSKEFHDALEVLSSNKEIFLKFLEEPQSQAVLPSRRKCITLLRPSIFLDMTSKKQQLSEEMLAEVSGGGSNRLNQGSGRSYSNLGSLSHPTRIVVLKPSPRKFHEIKLPVLHQRPPKGKDDFFEELGSVETTKSREVAKEITWHMRESISNRKDEKLLFPAMSNGYMVDDSSFNRSEIAYMEEELGIFSDSQAMTPTSQCSWDHINQYGSPYSPSSYSRTSHVTESSLTIEAKKRLSDRLTMVTTNGGSQEYKQVRRSSSTLAEMLSFSDTTKRQTGKEDSYILSDRDYTGNCGSKIDSSHLCSNRDFVENAGEKLPTSLQRSRSVPVSSAHDVPDLRMEGSKSHLGDKGITKSKSLKFSLKEKVSSLFSRNKKPREETIIPPVTPRPPHKVPSVSDTCNSEKVNPLAQMVDYFKPEEETTPFVEESPNKNLITLQHFLKEGPSFAKEDLSVGKSSLSEIPSQNTEQPSPVSVLEAVFDEDSCSSSSQTRDVATPECERAIARSPLIDSLTSTLSWDENACPEETNVKPCDSPIDSLELDVEEQERLEFVKSLIQASSLHNGTPNTVQSKWYSPETPLNPSLLDKFVQHKEEGAKCRERRSSQKLLFDCVNAALLEIGQTNSPDSCLSFASNFRNCNSNPLNNSVMEEVSLRIIRWFSADQQWSRIDYSSFAVDHVIKKEVNGRGWEEKVRSEITLIVRDIERDILNELVAETMDGLILSACKEDILVLSPYL